MYCHPQVMNTVLRLWWTCFLCGIAADSMMSSDFIPIGRDSEDGAVQRHLLHRRHRHRASTAEQQHLRALEEYEQQREEYRQKVKEANDQYFDQYLERMRQYAAQIQVRRYQELLQRQQMERDSIAKTMGHFGVATPDLHSGTTLERSREEKEERPSSPFGDLQPVQKSGREPRSRTSGIMNLPEQHTPSQIEPRPENRDVHRKAMALEALCARFQPTVRKHCYGRGTAREYARRCAAYFHDCQSFLPRSDPLYSIANAFNSNVGLNLGTVEDCQSFLPRSDPLYSIANAFNSNVGLNLGTVEVNGIPYYPINEEAFHLALAPPLPPLVDFAYMVLGSIGVGRVANVPFGSWGGGYAENLGVRDYWSQTMEVGANWYEGKYGYKSGWSVPLVQSLGVEGDTHAVVSVPIKQGELGKPIGVDVGGGVGPYYQQNQHVGVDYMNGQVGTNFGVGVPFAGVGVNTGLGVSFPSVNDIELEESLLFYALIKISTTSSFSDRR
ncbi:hypothetical protein COOONC_01559 [Cooperia oncophora]